MTCCIVAMLIIAHVMAVLRRWGIFWGVVQPVEGEDDETVFSRMRGWLALPRVRRVVLGLVAIEMVAAGSWIYTAHGTHLYRLGDQAVGAMRGQTIVYAGVCGKDGGEHTVRMVIDGHRKVSEAVI
jgi:hypothetical protein